MSDHQTSQLKHILLQPKKKKTKKKSKAESKAVQCDHAKIFDDALPQQDLDLMQSVFCAWDKKEDYWCICSQCLTGAFALSASSASLTMS